MVGRIIRKVSSAFYSYPDIPEDVEHDGPFGKLKVALVADHFTTECLSAECRIRSMTPANYRQLIADWKPDMVLVESAFHGSRGTWRYELARQSRLMRLSRPTAIHEVVAFARQCGVPAVFWNKDDGAYFDAFIDVACAFDHVFTTDQDCLPRYRERVPSATTVNTLMMACQPAFHFFDGFHFQHNDACFTGSYYRRILNARRQFLDMAFAAFGGSGMPLNVYDRNHGRFSRHFAFRYPDLPHISVHPTMSHRETWRAYKAHLVSLNVNTVTGSETMCSRRLIEILACGGIAVTNPSMSVNKYFADFCHVISSQEEAEALFGRLRHGPSSEDLERAEAGARYVHKMHTWTHRLEEICTVIKA